MVREKRALGFLFTPRLARLAGPLQGCDALPHSFDQIEFFAIRKARSFHTRLCLPRKDVGDVRVRGFASGAHVPLCTAHGSSIPARSPKGLPRVLKSVAAEHL